MAKIKKAMKGGSKVTGKKGGKRLESEQERQLRMEIERMKEEEAARQKEMQRKAELKRAGAGGEVFEAQPAQDPQPVAQADAACQG